MEGSMKEGKREGIEGRRDNQRGRGRGDRGKEGRRDNQRGRGSGARRSLKFHA